jgi:hypothetical protein
MNPLMSQNDKQHVLSLSTKTWSRDSHGLFDFEATQVKLNNLIIPENGLIARKKVEVRSISSLDELGEGGEFLMGVKYEKCNIYPLNTYF